MFLINAEHEWINIGDGAIFSLIAMIIVFLVLMLIILCVNILSMVKFKGEKVEEKAQVSANVQKKKLTIEDIKDEDMMVATLVATAEFMEETNAKEKDVRVTSIKQIG